MLLAVSATQGLDGETSSQASLTPPPNPAADLRPRLIMSRDCSGSTFVADWTKHFLRLHGIPAVFGIAEDGEEINDSEMLGKEHNPFFEPDAGTSIAAALDKLIRTAQSHGYAPLIKSTRVDQLKPEVKRVLHRYDTQAAIVLRANALDRVICQIKDCLQYPGCLDRLLAAGVCSSETDCFQSMGSVVNATTGAPSSLCFARRAMSQEEQQKQLRVHLNVEPRAACIDPSKGTCSPSAGCLAMRAQTLAAEEPPLQQARVKLVPSAKPMAALLFEQLSAYEWDSTAATGQSSRAWQELLVALGVAVNSTLLEGALTRRDTLPCRSSPYSRSCVNGTSLSIGTLASYAAPPPHDTVLHNAEEVRQSLRPCAADLSWMWRPSGNEATRATPATLMTSPVSSL